jgi:AcrR family transcriptional regulator
MTRQNNDDRRKEQIREAAIRCFVRNGVEKTRLLDIATEAELSKGGIYFHFKTKEALFADILEVVLRRLESRWAFEPVVDQPADRTLHRLVVAHLRTLEDEPDETRLGHLLVAMTPQNPGFREKLDESFRLMRALYGGVVRRGIEAGVFRDASPEVMADCVLAMVQGLAYQASTDPRGRLPVRPEDAADTALGMVLVESAAPSVRKRERSAGNEVALPS